mmetsp:Transcript_4223/g.7171  ORF Transcript_4223/g.7171 Transcript_4223/m.7171 type:complete len:90 (+) Transcript_4223:386-655(+)
MPEIAAIAGFAIVLGKSLYVYGYRSGGPPKRVIGAALSALGLLAVLVGSVISLVTWETSSMENDYAIRILGLSQEKYAAIFTRKYTASA